MDVILYTTNCPKCKILEMKLDDKNITYTVCNDTETMINKGFMSAPMFEVDGVVMDFAQAVKWINEQER